MVCESLKLLLQFTWPQRASRRSNLENWIVDRAKLAVLAQPLCIDMRQSNRIGLAQARGPETTPIDR